MSKTFKYIGRIFKQRETGLSCIQLLAPAEDIDEWGGVPQKSSIFMKGYQRAEDEGRVDDVSEFFELEENISPTAIVVAFRPNQARCIELKVEYDGADVSEVHNIGQTALLEITCEDYTELSVNDLAKLVCDTLHEEASQDRASSQMSYIEGDQPDGNGSETFNETEEGVTEEEDDAETEEHELSIYESHLAEFIEFLRSAEQLETARQEDEDTLRMMLTNLLKPGIIVDGQHRTKGAADLEQQIPFTVVGLLDAGWEEQAFQFIVINQKAKPIAPEFLSSIISSSLSNTNIEHLRVRLEQAKINLESTTLIGLVNNSEQSPFKGQVSFKVKGESGALSYAGMLTLARRFRDLRTHEPKIIKFRPFFERVFAPVCSGRNYQERKEAWLKGEWFNYFTAFWDGAKSKYADIWEPRTNFYKIVTLQELQNLFLEWLFKRSEALKDLKDLEEKASLFLNDISPEFFKREWRLKSIQTVAGRRYLRAAIEKARLDPKRYKYDDDLFKGAPK